MLKSLLARLDSLSYNGVSRSEGESFGQAGASEESYKANGKFLQLTLCVTAGLRAGVCV
ncbi:hypothetical protein [Chlamydiifrater volucris]|nr:hypothetical protein [Chlamydiifrater volucris]